MDQQFEQYKEVLSEVNEFSVRLGRSDEPRLVAVSKGSSCEQIVSAFQSGCLDFGENRVQELLEKRIVCPPEIRWHFLGTLQKNKVKKLIGNVFLIHSVDSLELAETIGLHSKNSGICTSILLQVNISGEETKQGFSEEGIKNEIEKLVLIEGVSIQGLMTMAPYHAENSLIRDYFKRLRELRDFLQGVVGKKTVLKELSMGMSHDFPIAIEEGATVLRVGSAIFPKQ